MASEVRSYTVSVFQTISIASRSPDKTFSPDVGCVRFARMRFLSFRRPLSYCVQ
nr:MAG TPA: hypothetical protein [Caudoviricetes sp.]